MAPAVTVFVCANCARPARAPSSAGLPRPRVPDFGWPFSVREVLVQYLEGSKRCARRVDYIRSILEEIGLGGERLMLFHLPGTAAEDMALAAGRPVSARSAQALEARVAAIRDEVQQALEGLPANPLHEAPVVEAAGESYQEVNRP